MTLEQLLKYSRDLIRINERAYVVPSALEVAQAIIDMLGESQPCGMEAPTVINGLVLLDDEEYTASEIRAICAVYLRCADEADAQTKGE